MSEIAPGEKAWAFFLATKNVASALDEEDTKRARRNINKTIKANRALRFDIGWPFEKLDRADMVRLVREHWREFGSTLDALEEQYGITREKPKKKQKKEKAQDLDAPF